MRLVHVSKQFNEEANVIFSHLVAPLVAGKRVTVVSACDENYFPLAQGLYLSLIQSGRIPENVNFAFVDIGCSDRSVEWLTARGITVRALDIEVMGKLCDERYSYRRGQTCRAFLPLFFPDADVLVWMDPDMWVQDIAGFLAIVSAAAANSEKVFISQEVHQGFVDPGSSFTDRIAGEAAIFGYHYGPVVGARLSQRPTYNTGLLAISSHHEIWEKWQAEVERIYVTDYQELKDGRYFHFGDQASFNYLLMDLECVEAIDPLYNYVCIWNPPFRSGDGLVRTTAVPHLPIGIVHLAGGWKRLGDLYVQRGLLFDEGSYLDELGREALAATDHFPR